jgi:DNA-binding transcriptional ArsR family regulator
VEALEVLGDPVRRRILELLADGEVTSGGVCALIRAGPAGTPAP